MRFRLAMAGDLEACRTRLHPEYRVFGQADDRLPELWRRLHEEEPAAFVVVEDSTLPWPRSLEGFLASVFVTDAFVEEFRTARRPSLSAFIYDRIIAGCSPVLTATEVGDANSAHGLNLVLLHIGVRTPEGTDRCTAQALRQIGAALFFFRAGYRLNVVLGEAFGRQQADFMVAAGLRPLDDFEEQRSADEPPARGPFLFMMRKEWNQPAPLGQISMLFHAPEASLGLSPTEQRAVLGALLGQTDREIAETGGISLDAVKKTWRRIYERMASTRPYLDVSSHDPSAADRRSAEKRRRLVEYLRYHPEELRPVSRRNHSSMPRAARSSPPPG